MIIQQSEDTTNIMKLFDEKNMSQINIILKEIQALKDNIIKVFEDLKIHQLNIKKLEKTLCESKNRASYN